MTPTEIAHSLTEARREFVLALPADGSMINVEPTVLQILGRHGLHSLRNFADSGLFYTHCIYEHPLTCLIGDGLAVRAALERMNDA